MHTQADKNHFNSPLCLCLVIGSSKAHLNLRTVTGLEGGVMNDINIMSYVVVPSFLSKILILVYAFKQNKLMTWTECRCTFFQAYENNTISWL